MLKADSDPLEAGFSTLPGEQFTLPQPFVTLEYETLYTNTLDVEHITPIYEPRWNILNLEDQIDSALDFLCLLSYLLLPILRQCLAES